MQDIVARVESLFRIATTRYLSPVGFVCADVRGSEEVTTAIAFCSLCGHQITAVSGTASGVQKLHRRKAVAHRKTCNAGE